MLRFTFLILLSITYFCGQSQGVEPVVKDIKTDSTELLSKADTLKQPTKADTTSLKKSKSIATTRAIPTATETEKDTTTAVAEPRKFIRDFGLYVDYGKLIGLFVPYEEKYESGVRIIFGNNLFIAGEYGQATILSDKAFKNYDYTSDGSYWRIGGGFLNELSAKTNLGVGLFYGQSTFQDNGKPTNLDSELASFTRSDLSATWYEINVISESKVFKSIYAGINFRLRVMGKYDEQPVYDVFTIPGYGRTFDKSLPVVNLFLRIKLF
jgi:hypothetical protein